MPRGKPFAPGRSPNPAGRPKGIKAKPPAHMQIMHDIFVEGIETVAQKTMQMAEAGDGTAMRLYLERMFPPLKERPIHFAMPEIDKPADLVLATRAILYGVTSGEISPGEGDHLQALVLTHIKAIEASDLATRLKAVEAHLSAGAPAGGGDDDSEI